MAIWNPWHGCHKISPGCFNCYVYRRDESVGKDASVVTKTGDYDLPVKRNRQGEYKLGPEEGVVFTCMTSDFFLADADDWRPGCWDMIRQRPDLHFFIITKRIDRFALCAPPCDFRWIQEVRRQCIRCGVPFYFKQTGAVFVKDGKT